MRAHIPREEERTHERPRIEVRCIMAACGEEKEKCGLKRERIR
jgi:hypothetical protein